MAAVGCSVPALLLSGFLGDTGAALLLLLLVVFLEDFCLVGFGRCVGDDGRGAVLSAGGGGGPGGGGGMDCCTGWDGGMCVVAGRPAVAA